MLRWSSSPFYGKNRKETQPSGDGITEPINDELLVVFKSQSGCSGVAGNSRCFGASGWNEPIRRRGLLPIPLKLNNGIRSERG